MVIESMELTTELKEKIIRSYIRGADNRMNAITKGVLEEDVEHVITELWHQAREEGKQVQVGKNRFLSEKEIWLMGETAHYTSLGQYRNKFKLSEHQTKVAAKVYAKMTGREIEQKVLNKELALTRMKDSTITCCPECGNQRLNDVGEVSATDLMPVYLELKINKMAVEKNLYCIKCMNEFLEIRHKESHEWNGVFKLNHWALAEY